MNSNFELETKIGCALKKNVSSIEPIRGTKNKLYRVGTEDGNYFVKFSNRRNIFTDVDGIRYFGDILGFSVPGVVYASKNCLILNEEENLERINLENMVMGVLNYQQRDLEVFGKRDYYVQSPVRFSREFIDKNFSENFDLFSGTDSSKIQHVLSIVHPGIYSDLPLSVCHGDVHRKNFFMKSGLPFFLDFEKFGWEVPTFDISSAIYSNPREGNEILDRYLFLVGDTRLNVGQPDFSTNLILADTARIAIQDLINASSRGELNKVEYDLGVLNILFS